MSAVDGHKKRFRHPLRNEWDRHHAAFAAMTMKPGRDGVMARAMLELIPPFLDVIERERDNATPAHDMFDAVAAVAGMMVENAIETQMLATPGAIGARAALHRMLAKIEAVVLPKVAGGKVAGLILPNGFTS